MGRTKIAGGCRIGSTGSVLDISCETNDGTTSRLTCPFNKHSQVIGYGMGLNKTRGYRAMGIGVGNSGSRTIFSPAQKIVFAAMLGLLVHVLVIWVAANQPWLGVNVAENPDGVGWVVTAVPDDSNAHGKIKVGDVIVAVLGKDGTSVEANPIFLRQELLDIPTAAQWAVFIHARERLSFFLHQGAVAVSLGNGERVSWELGNIGYAKLDFDSWFGILMSLVVWLIVSFIWIYSETTLASRYLLLLGLGYWGIACGPVVFSGNSFIAVTDGWARLNYFGSGLFSGALVSLLMVYPSRLVSNKLSVIPLLVWTPLMLLLPYLPVSPSVFMHTYSFVLLLALIVLVFSQWLRAREQAVQRAMFRWFFGVTLLSICLAIILLLIGVGVGFVMTPICLMFVGFVFGVRRYRLFDVERWWFAMWAWVIGGMAVMALDMLLVWGIGLGQSVSLTLALVIAGWAYFPLRQKLWSRWVGGAKQTTEQYLPDVIASIFGEDMLPLQQRWQGLLRRIFQPLTVETSLHRVERVELAEDGTVLLLPGVAGEPGLRLGCPQQGKRLYSRQDAQLAQALVELGRKALQVRDAREQGAEAERQRIVRDLHDDVGAELVTLMHRLQHTEHGERVAQISRNLRGVVSGLSHRAMPMFEASGEWRAEAEERCRLAGVILSWRGGDGLENIILTPRQFINLSRILREAITNALRHAQPASLEVALHRQDGNLELAVSDDGIGMNEQWREGNGCRNMRMRAEELGGSLACHSATGKGCRMMARIPLISVELIAAT